MPDEYRNIYKTCRKAAGLTQEAAAERLGISVESVRAYETGQRVPPNEVVELMVILYNAQHLAFQHLRETNGLYSSVVPEIRPKSVLEASVKLDNRFDAFMASNKLRRLLRIAEDNIVDATEKAEFDFIQEELQGLLESIMELRCARQEGGASCRELP